MLLLGFAGCAMRFLPLLQPFALCRPGVADDEVLTDLVHSTVTLFALRRPPPRDWISDGRGVGGWCGQIECRPGSFQQVRARLTPSGRHVAEDQHAQVTRRRKAEPIRLVSQDFVCCSHHGDHVLMLDVKVVSARTARDAHIVHRERSVRMRWRT